MPGNEMNSKVTKSELGHHHTLTTGKLRQMDRRKVSEGKKKSNDPLVLPNYNRV